MDEAPDDLETLRDELAKPLDVVPDELRMASEAANRVRIKVERLGALSSTPNVSLLSPTIVKGLSNGFMSPGLAAAIKPWTISPLIDNVLKNHLSAIQIALGPNTSTLLASLNIVGVTALSHLQGAGVAPFLAQQKMISKTISEALAPNRAMVRSLQAAMKTNGVGPNIAAFASIQQAVNATMRPGSQSFLIKGVLSQIALKSSALAAVNPAIFSATKQLDLKALGYPRSELLSLSKALEFETATGSIAKALLSGPVADAIQPLRAGNSQLSATDRDLLGFDLKPIDEFTQLLSTRSDSEISEIAASVEEEGDVDPTEVDSLVRLVLSLFNLTGRDYQADYVQALVFLFVFNGFTNLAMRIPELANTWGTYVGTGGIVVAHKSAQMARARLFPMDKRDD